MTEPSTPPRFAGKVAIITGTSDRGIGGATALRMADEGASLVMVSRHLPERLLKRLEKTTAPHVHMLADITIPEDVEKIVATCREKFGKLDILINNAGIEVASRLVDSSEAEWRNLLDVNLNGSIALTKAALPQLSQPGGVIVNVASALGLAGCAGFSVYSASKAGLIGFTQSLAWEVAKQGIRVVAVAPGLVVTPMVQKHTSKLTHETWAQLEACHPLGVGRAADVAAAITFLASEDARWITGITLPLGFAHQYPLPVMGE
ncbi:3-oxoacyl-[acyl-carrier-protein] reductase FabG [Anatilimnocola aggregata]|uniref:3-oxoacyl-[acyl-carrier-protein] reductase FabG n=2 Tax=Anatilimnocola aggregata TaxID=2528021 RepID=A0A517YB20_9BACT|nr:3-oxoacyl-[acyl-carrier-protein] reductase FabG [Anatilimnocola aggregata]